VRLKALPMPDLDQFKQGEQGAWDWRERLPNAGRARPRSPRPRQPRRGRERDAVCCRFAANNSKISSRGQGKNGLDRLASDQPAQVSIYLALSLRGACAPKQSRPTERQRLEIAFPRVKPAGRNDDWSE
jgi:hypothetical protein